MSTGQSTQSTLDGWRASATPPWRNRKAKRTGVESMRGRPKLQRLVAEQLEVDGYVRVDRRNRALGNPFKIGVDGTREEVIAKYETKLWQELRTGTVSIAQMAAMKGKVLVCWCAPNACHAEIIAAAAEWCAEITHTG